MPYKKLGTAIAHYLRLFKSIAETYGNPFVIAYLPEPVTVDGKQYSRESISRYRSWILKYYREKGREPPIRIEYLRDSKRGKVAAIHVDIERIDTEIELLEKDETPWPLKSRGRRDKEIERLKKRIRRLEEKLKNCRTGSEEQRVKSDLEKTVKELKTRIAKLEEEKNRLVSLLERLVALDPADVMKCVEQKPDDLVCGIVRVILDRALSVVDGVAPIDIVMGEIGDDYVSEVEKLREKLLAQLQV